MLLILGLILKAWLGGGGGGGFNLPGARSQSVQVQPQNPNAVQLGRGAASGVTQNCKTGADANRRQDCRIVGIANSVQAYWADDLPRRGKEYVKAKTVLFSGSVSTGCGGATAAAGPFYCPADQHVYLDLDFFKVFESQFGGTDTPFTKAYVIAHEYGHLVQNLLGISAKVEVPAFDPVSSLRGGLSPDVSPIFCFHISVDFDRHRAIRIQSIMTVFTGPGNPKMIAGR